jgi:MFS family permease
VTSSKNPTVPPLIRRNTWLLFLAQAALSTGLATSAQLGSLIIYRISGTATWAGVPTALTALTVAAVGYPAGRFMDRRGRRPGLVLGFAVGAVGAVLVAVGVTSGRMVGFLFGALVFSVGIAVGQLTRAAVADMYPAALRAGAVGLVVTGGLVGGVGGPMLVSLGDRIARAVGADPLAVPWLFVLVTFGIAAAVLVLLRPDPRDISRRLAAYFPGVPEAGAGSGALPVNGWAGEPSREASVGEIIASRPAQAAMIAIACAQAAMVILMATSSLMLSLHGHSMHIISLALMAHVAGMFAFSVPVGRLADRIGRRPMLIGGALLSASSGLMFTLGIHSAAIAMVAFYLVGLGWCLAFVAGAALLGDLSTAGTRARVVGLSDVLTHGSSMVAALISGVLLARGGEVTVGVMAAVLGSVPLLAIFRAGREWRPTATAAAPAAGGK